MRRLLWGSPARVSMHRQRKPGSKLTWKHIMFGDGLAWVLASWKLCALETWSSEPTTHWNMPSSRSSPTHNSNSYTVGVHEIQSTGRLQGHFFSATASDNGVQQCWCKFIDEPECNSWFLTMVTQMKYLFFFLNIMLQKFSVIGILPKCLCWTHLSCREWIKIPLQECFEAERQKPCLLESEVEDRHNQHPHSMLEVASLVVCDCS